MTWREQFFAWWAAICHDHAWTVALVMAAITAFFAYFAVTIEINLGFLSLLDENDPLVHRVDDANDNFGGLDYLIIGLVTPDGQPVDKDTLIRFAKALVPKLRARPDMVAKIFDRIDLGEMLRWAPLFLEGKDLDDFIRTTTDRRADLANAFADTRLVPFLNEMNALLEREIIEENEITDDKAALDQLEALGEFYETAWTYLENGENMEAAPAKRSLRKLMLPVGENDQDLPADDYYFVDNDHMLMLRMMATQPLDDYIHLEAVMAVVDAAIAEVSSEVPGVQVLLAGNMAVMRDEHLALVRDMQMSTILSMVLVLIIFAVVFRKLTDLALIAICLMAGLAITFGLTKFTIGYLSLLTAFFGAIMIGLGIDFAIHLISRYGENIRNGLQVRESIIGAMVGAGPGILTGGITTAAAFLALLIARFKGLAQLGLVSGMGILVMLLLMFTLLPALICLRDRRKVASDITVKSIGDSLPLGRLADVAVHHPRLGGIVVALLLVAGVYGAMHTSFNYDYRSLEPRGSIAIAHIDEVEKRLGKSIDYGMFIVDTVEDSRRLTALAEQQSTVREVESISQFVPADQDAKIAKIAALAPVFAAIDIKSAPEETDRFDRESLLQYAAAARGSARVARAVLQLAILGGKFDVEKAARETAESIDAVAAQIEAHADEHHAKGATVYQGFIADELAFILQSLKKSTDGQKLTVDKLPEVIRENFVGKDGRYAVYLYPTGNIWNEQYMHKHNAELLSVDPSAVSIGLLFEKVVRNIMEDLRSSVWYSLLAVFLLVLVDFRRLTTALLALIPLLTGALWMVGIMPLLGMQFNMANISMVPLILGIGIDNGVHILHRYRMEKTDRVHFAVEHTGKAILLSSLTTMAGFGMLGLASYVAIGTLGQLLLVGVGFCFFTSVFVLPLILARFDKRGWKV